VAVTLPLIEPVCCAKSVLPDSTITTEMHIKVRKRIDLSF
jgi:hypothetical protein